jgi:hypothetical protein
MILDTSVLLSASTGPFLRRRHQCGRNILSRSCLCLPKLSRECRQSDLSLNWSEIWYVKLFLLKKVFLDSVYNININIAAILILYSASWIFKCFDVLQVVKWSAYTETTIFIDAMDNLNLTDLTHAEILFTSKFLFIIIIFFFYLVCLS